MDNLIILDQNGHPIQYDRVVRTLHWDPSPEPVLLTLDDMHITHDLVSVAGYVKM